VPRLRSGSRPAPSAGPRTWAGLWLRAALRGENELRRQLTGRLNGGKEGWNYDEPAVVDAACELAVRRFFPPGVDVREITAVASDMRQKSKSLPGQLKVEAVIRSALGEADVVIDDIKPPELLHIRGAIVTYLFIILGAKFSVDELITEAENIAFERGWKPPLAD
jgi:hypothetical protein